MEFYDYDEIKRAASARDLAFKEGIRTRAPEADSDSRVRREINGRRAVEGTRSWDFVQLL